MKIKLLFTLSLAFFLTCSTSATVRYVRQGFGGSGSSWELSSGDLQYMINESSYGDTIFVAQGIYYPIRPFTAPNLIFVDSSNNAFLIKKGIKVLGGFDSIGSPLLTSRDYVTYQTILSGNLGVLSDSLDNAKHVVVVPPDADTNTYLDGFTIRDGVARNEPDLVYLGTVPVNPTRGGGIACYGGRIRLSNLIVEHNSSYIGGGAYFTYDYATLSNCVFRNNISFRDGGGMYCYNSSKRISYCDFTANSCVIGSGGAIYNDNSVLRVRFSRIIGNSAVYSGGCVNYFGGDSYYSCIFSGNTADDVGAYAAGIYSTTTLNNVTISGNSATTNCGAVSLVSSANVYNSIVWGNEALTNPGMQLGLGGGIVLKNNIIQENYWEDNWEEDPGFVNPAPIVGVSAEDGDYHLSTCSFARDRGNNDFHSGLPNLDLENNFRKINVNIDLGAYEYQGSIYTDTICLGDSLIWDESVYKASGIYVIDTLLSIDGCDSIISLNLEVNSVDTSVVISSGTLYSTNDNATTYQWIECSSGVPIPGATNKSFAPTHIGQYKLAVTEGDCSDTSSCYLINPTGIFETDNSNQLKIYPNPATDFFMMENLSNATIDKIMLFSTEGKLLEELPVKNILVVSIANYPNGIYILKTFFKNGIEQVVKIVKQ